MDQEDLSKTTPSDDTLDLKILEVYFLFVLVPLKHCIRPGLDEFLVPSINLVKLGILHWVWLINLDGVLRVDVFTLNSKLLLWVDL